MSQHDFNIANQSFPATRTDLNNALQALASNSSGDAEPSTTFANQWWYETDTNTLKLRNEANNAWLSFATVDQTTGAWTLAHDVDITGTALVTGVLTTTAATVFNGGFTANVGSTITTADNTTQLSLISTDTDANTGPVLALWRNSASSADGDNTGKIAFQGEDDGGNKTTYSTIDTFISDNTNGTEDGQLALKTIVAGTERHRINMKSAETVINDDSVDLDFRVKSDTDANAFFVEGSSGNVGIGTSSPSALVHIKQSDGTPSTGLKVVRYNNDNQYLSLWANGGARYFDAVGDSSLSSVNIFRSSIDSGSTFTETMRIDSSGAVLVGTTDTDPYDNNANSAADNGIVFSGSIIRTAKYNDSCAAFNRTGTNGGIISFRKSGSNCGNISVTASSTAYNTSSDYRLKTDAQPMTGASARVLALKPVNFEWLSDGTRVDGFLAHEAQEVVPECVTGTKDGMRDEEYEVTAAVLDADGMVVTEAVMGTRSVPDMQGIDQSKLVPLLTAALQEALTEISALKVRVAALEV
jgi:hypothetical protein